ncbi:Crp/Fnr family transcriptional regulator [uncultured Dokdonia sp.]|uniref:Crp/Fnr family transcriptional regulator n=1 Tax=uncultured Dokdonia sp. TaxID=575653 RepID=UPI00260D21B1|nr:Crp/Fnr family transcriptional regulator [uncultured Dokdonia sp.]
MTVNNSFEAYLLTVINDTSLNHLVPEVLDTFSQIQLSKNEFFVTSGSICKYFCYIESGILQHSLDVLEEEKTTYLALKNSCTAALNSFKNNLPSRKNIKALTDCVLQVITIQEFEYLMQHNQAFYTFYYNLIENQIYKIDDHRIDLLILTPEERYQKLLHTEPTLLQKVPLHYLASFLGISLRHMSRIRKNIK